ncbi:hypothetical protein BV25DRAFT_1824957 [Artomyces pyxidatus]|uniref:Uncharacterized protein n=2 Tax=Auriscalpiaceae TaxID=40417 RepID=A0ACB8T3E0_9AGAM|nr:hypothetical protein BV25DRAFT_1824957 [Artomyces pyxidatus]
MSRSSDLLVPSFPPLPSLPLIPFSSFQSMPPRPNQDDETRRGEYRPTLPPIRDLFGRELSQPPRPHGAPVPVGYSPSAHFNQLSLPDESTPYSGEQSRAGHAQPHMSYASGQNPSGSAPSRPLTNTQGSAHFSAGRYQNPAPHSFPSQSEINAPQPTRAPSSHGRSASSPDPYGVRAQPTEDPSEWTRRGSHYSAPPYPYQNQPAPSHSTQQQYASNVRASGMPAPYPYAPQIAAQRSYGASHESGLNSAQLEQASGSSAKYECTYCGKGFTRPSSLKIHLHSHTGERPYACTFEGCDRTFSVQSNMRRHARTHTQTGQAQESSGEDESEGSPHISPRATGSGQAS